jgi:hypothetical protein
MVQLLAALGVGAMLLPRPAAERDWSATVWEAVPLALSVGAVAVAFQAVSQGAGNVALLFVVAYLVITAMRLPLRQHRWAYWWFARAAATVLTLTAFDQLQRDAGTVVIGDEVVRPALVLVTVLALQLCLPLVAAARRRAPRGIAADAAAVILVQLVATALLAQADSAGWQHTSATVLAALGGAASGYFLRREAGAVWLAPCAFVSLLAFSNGSLLIVELVLGIFAVYAALMVVAEPQRAWKGWYFVAARVLTAGLALVLSYDITASPTVVSVTFALVLAAQHGVRWAMRARLAEVPYQQAAVWITLAGQAFLPLVYVGGQSAAGLAAQHDDGGRWVVLFELLLLLVSAAVARKLFTARGSFYFAVYAALFGVLALGPLVIFGGTFLVSAVFSHTGTAAVLLTVALLAVAAGALRRRRSVDAGDIEHWLWLVTAGSFAGVGLVVSPWAAGWVTGAAVLVLAVVLFAASHVEDQALLYPPAALATLWGAIAMAGEALPDTAGAWGGFLLWLAGAGPASVALYAGRLIRGDALRVGRLDESRLDDGRLDEGRMDDGCLDEGRVDGRPAGRRSGASLVACGRRLPGSDPGGHGRNQARCHLLDGRSGPGRRRRNRLPGGPCKGAADCPGGGCSGSYGSGPARRHPCPGCAGPAEWPGVRWPSRSVLGGSMVRSPGRCPRRVALRLRPSAGWTVPGGCRCRAVVAGCSGCRLRRNRCATAVGAGPAGPAAGGRPCCGRADVCLVGRGRCGSLHFVGDEELHVSAPCGDSCGADRLCSLALEPRPGRRGTRRACDRADRWTGRWAGALDRSLV